MSDDITSGEDFLRAVQAFVAEKWQPHHPCDRCGTFQWSVLPGDAVVLSSDTYDRRIFDPEVRERRVASPSAAPHSAQFIPVYCNNCGNTVNIYLQVFLEWLKNRQTT